MKKVTREKKATRLDKAELDVSLTLFEPPFSGVGTAPL
jgi:hypothetical protein